MSATGPPPRSGAAELGRFLEIQNLGLNLPFALAFLLVAGGGHPTLRATALVIVAFVAARNAGHSFNRWLDRELDARNPRTQDRALVTGRISEPFALGFALGNAALLALAAFLLNPLALLLVPVALALVLGYSYTKRLSALTTVFLGLVESVTPAAVFIALQGTLPLAAVVAAVALGAWGTAFETIHSIGDVDADRAAGTYSLPLTTGIRTAVRIVPILHAVAIGLLAIFGGLEHLPIVYFAALGAMALWAGSIDVSLSRDPLQTRRLFRRHFGLSAVFLIGVIFSYVF
ncbi:MAG: UbiA family prenyltransferase [Thermoplasmata archaeon]|nr:UbiA family prenyltransferase [Thermoplasmata archaeon]